MGCKTIRLKKGLKKDGGVKQVKKGKKKMGCKIITLKKERKDGV